MASSYIASQYMEHQETINDSTEIDWNNGDEVLILSQRSTRALKEARARAAMARPVSEDESVKVIKDKSVAIVDCGASSTLTGSLINATDIEEKVTIIETADGEERMRSSHKCIKTYFVRNRMGDPVPISVPALFVRGLPQDLIGGKAVNKINIRVILDDDPDICGLYPLTKDKEQHYQDSIEFISEYTDLFYLQTEEMDWTRFNAANGYEVWHQRLGHVPFRNIEQTIQHSIGLEGLIGKRYPKDHKCLSCMIGKSTLENYPGSKEPDPRPMALVHMDVYSSSVTSIEGYNHALIITDSCSEHRWQYGMKTKDEVLAMSKRWVAETADIQKDHPILVVVRDNAGENTSKELNDYFTERGIKNYFSTPYEQWQNGLAEASVNSVPMLGRG